MKKELNISKPKTRRSSSPQSLVLKSFKIIHLLAPLFVMKLLSCS